MPSRIFSNSFYIAFASILLVVGCRTVKGTKENCREGEKTCEGNIVNICLDGKWTVWDDCSSLNMTCTMIAGSAQCIENTADMETENISTSVDIDIDTDADTDADADADTDTDVDTDSARVVTETPENVCNCVSRLFNSESGIAWMKDSCIDNIHEDCLSCYDQKLGGRDCSDLEFKEIAIAMAECAAQCPEPITAPSNEEQCLDVLFSSAIKTGRTNGSKGLFTHCVCSNCFDSFRDCLSNQGCTASLACILTQQDSSLLECQNVYSLNSFSYNDSLTKMTTLVGCINFDHECAGYLGLTEK